VVVWEEGCCFLGGALGLFVGIAAQDEECGVFGCGFAGEAEPVFDVVVVLWAVDAGDGFTIGVREGVDDFAFWDAEGDDGTLAGPIVWLEIDAVDFIDAVLSIWVS
jgi:hypothetical protein